MEKVGEIYGVKIYVTDGYEMVMSQCTFNAFRVFVESVLPMKYPIAGQGGENMDDVSYTKKVIALRKKHGFDSQEKLPMYVDLLEEEIIAVQQRKVRICPLWNIGKTCVWSRCRLICGAYACKNQRG